MRNILYINLSDRKDRKHHINEQLTSLGWTGERFDAIKLKNGRVGCSLSHLQCLILAKKRKWKYVLICEDDITFLDPDLFKIQLNKFLSYNIEWDVILIAGNNIPPYQEIGNFCARVSHCQTTTGYIVKQDYYDILIANIREGSQQLLHKPDKHVLYAIDKYWIQLQQQDRWYLILPPTVIQKEDYSDIERKMINYQYLLLDYEKKSVFPNHTKKIVILLYSCHKNKHKIKFLKKIGYINQLIQNGFFVFIVVGNPQQRKEWIIDDYDLILKCKDDYESFPQKVIKAMSIIHKLYGTTIKGIIKHDDDMVLNMEYLLKHLPYIMNQDYVGKHGNELENYKPNYNGLKNSTEYRGPYMNGATGYWLSTKSLGLLSEYIKHDREKFIPGELFEDKLVGDILRLHNISIETHNKIWDGWIPLIGNKPRNACKHIEHIHEMFIDAKVMTLIDII